jgi:hypothetical protein
MSEEVLRRILRSVMAVCVASPLVAVGVACSSTSSPPGAPDGSMGTPDGAPDGPVVGQSCEPACACPGATAPCPTGMTPIVVVPLPADAGLADGAVDEAGVVDQADCMRLCEASPGNDCACLLTKTDAGAPAIECGGCMVASAGRRPAGLSRRRPSGGSRVGEYFAASAHLEAASVVAFDVLERELQAHGAPARLCRAARRARRDEVRHARVLATLARRFGGLPAAPRVARARARSLEELAIENAAEGCVRETFGALTAMWQARTSESALVRKAMRRIAVDETRHAALAFDVAAWAHERLDGPAKARVERARQEARATLEREVQVEPAPSVVRVAGTPRPAQARALMLRLHAALQGGVAPSTKSSKNGLAFPTCGGGVT